jgi:serine/threonine-protein kinase RsbW
MTMLLHDTICTKPLVHELSHIRQHVSRFLHKAGIDDAFNHELCLAIDEACANIMLHGNIDANTLINISLEYHDDYCRVIIEDNGASFNPMDIPPTNMDEYFINKQYGGLGIEIIRRIIDEMKYEHSQQQYPWNTLSLMKYFHSSRH